ncbi:hypothetical protein NZK33_18270 [Cyanobium sp. FGCU-6]|jgi:hypothetical protein|nr:hypothetical protein [Cyanobium sp. FGCU6]
MDLQPGTFVRLEGRQGDTYQVVSVDDYADSCWVRRWPLPRRGSPVFSVPLHELSQAQANGSAAAAAA